jgi:hypothetical protein
MRVIMVAMACLLLSSCTSTQKIDSDNLYKFAQANCLYWYFEKKGYDTTDIRSISGGFVEKSDSSLDKFEDISMFVKSYVPSLDSKNNIDADLNRCFQLRESTELRVIIEG